MHTNKFTNRFLVTCVPFFSYLLAIAISAPHFIIVTLGIMTLLGLSVASYSGLRAVFIELKD